jgi:hypothetical protein
MSIATLIDCLATNSMPPYVIASYNDTDGVSAGSDSTALIEIELPGLYNSEPSYRTEPRTTLTNKSYVIDLAGFSISCSSTNYTVRILTRNDPKLINTIYEVGSYTGINLSMNDTFSRFIIRNRDVILDNKLYLFITNSGAMDTGIISIELAYISLQDREF